MKVTFTRVFILLAAFVGFRAVALVAEPKNAQSEVKQLFNAAVARARLPEEVKAALGSFAGDFATTSQVHIAPPPAEPMTAHATTSGKWVMGGLFVQVNAASDPDEELKGERMIVYGYDPALKKYTMWQIESGNPAATNAVGTYDSVAKTFTFEGERELGPRGKAAVRWTIAVQPDGSLKQSLSLKPQGEQDFSEFVSVMHTKKDGK